MFRPSKLAMAVVMATAPMAPAWAATYYVRPDGGTAAQCTGLSDAAYDGAGTGEACAWKSLSVALGIEGGPAANIAGGDTVIVKNGSYPIGYHAGFDLTGFCSSSARSSCYLRAAPAGPSSASKTRILGENSEAGCRARPELWGTGGVQRMLNFQMASNTEYACLEITDHSPCVAKHHDSAKLCVTNSGDWAYQGGRGEGGTNILLRDLNIHGMAHFGLYVAALNTWTNERLRLHANGFGGWNGEISGGLDDSNTGTISFTGGEISFNGCTENYPSLAIHACIGQNGDDYDGSGPVTKTAGSDGYGDGVGTGNTGGNWVFEDMLVHHNVQDGIDMLYLTEAGGTMVARRVRSWGNAGNQMKLSGLVTVENSVLVGQCDYFASPQRYYPAMTIAGGDSCRASGNPLVLRPAKATGTAATVRFSTITGKGDMLVNVSPGGLGADAGTIVSFENNVFVGQAEYSDGSPTELAYIIPGTTKPTLQWKNNHVHGVGSTADADACPSGSYCAAAPQLRDTSVTAFDARPTAGSNVLGTGTACGGSCTIPSTDLAGKARPASPARGALEL